MILCVLFEYLCISLNVSVFSENLYFISISNHFECNTILTYVTLKVLFLYLLFIFLHFLPAIYSLLPSTTVSKGLNLAFITSPG